MNVQMLPCKLIDFPKASTGERSFVKEFAHSLAESIRVEGMFHPILVRPHPDPASKFKYQGIHGRHRLYAKHKVLKEETIEAKVVEMDDEQVAMARIAENLWRNPLNKTQHLKAIRAWWEKFKQQYPGRVGSGAHFAEKREQKVRADEAIKFAASNGEQKAHPEPLTDQAIHQPSPPAGNNFDETVAAATGQPLSTVKRTTRLAKLFTHEELQVFEQLNISILDINTVSKIKDRGLRNQVINLIASGMEPQMAIEEVMKDQVPVRTRVGASRAEEDAKGEAITEAVPNLSDEEWFNTYCGEKAGYLKDVRKYRADAILFRRLSDLRHNFRLRVKKHMAEAKKGGDTGPFYQLINRLISASHPRDWYICDGCSGRGKVDNGSQCKVCYGARYRLKTEDYL